MCKYVSVILLAFGIAASAQPFLDREENFFGIPGLESLSTRWFLEQSDSTYAGFGLPIDLDVLKLSPTDFRLVILDAALAPHFHTFRIDQQHA